jgi:ABC-2 type transport system ATP-binding protein
VSHALDAQHIRVTFSDTVAVNDVSLQVRFGEIVTLLGPNGAGKTTLVETLLGFRAPTSGAAFIDGLNPVTHHREVVLRTGALLQRGGVWFPMTPRQVLDLTATYYPDPRNSNELLDQLDLVSCASTPWRRLSGGQQQRTLLALALLGQPRVLVLDEPTSAVDPEGRQVIRQLLHAERDRGCALLITTHELVEAERTTDRALIMHRGSIVAEGRLDELAGPPVVIIETSGPVAPEGVSHALGVRVTALTPTTLRCETSNDPAVLATITAHLNAVGVELTGLRTRASLEERYLELVGGLHE